MTQILLNSKPILQQIQLYFLKQTQQMIYINIHSTAGLYYLQIDTTYSHISTMYSNPKEKQVPLPPKFKKIKGMTNRTSEFIIFHGFQQYFSQSTIWDNLTIIRYFAAPLHKTCTFQSFFLSNTAIFGYFKLIMCSNNQTTSCVYLI